MIQDDTAHYRLLPEPTRHDSMNNEIVIKTRLPKGRSPENTGVTAVSGWNSGHQAENCGTDAVDTVTFADCENGDCKPNSPSGAANKANQEIYQQASPNQTRGMVQRYSAASLAGGWIPETVVISRIYLMRDRSKLKSAPINLDSGSPGAWVADAGPGPKPPQCACHPPLSGGANTA